MAVVHITHRGISTLFFRPFFWQMKCAMYSIGNMFFSICAYSNRKKVRFCLPSCLYVTPVQLHVLNLFILKFGRKRVSRQRNGVLASCHCQSKAACALCHVLLLATSPSDYSVIVKVVDTPSSLNEKK